MGKKAVKKYFDGLILLFTVVLFIFTFIGLYGGDVNPVGHNVRATSTIVLPFFFCLNIVVLLYWGIRRSWFVFIPVIPIACSISFVGTLFQFGSKPANADYDFFVATYNVRMFNQDGTGVVAADVLNSLKKEGADILCMQEFDNTMSGDQRTVAEKIQDTYPYQFVVRDMAILSQHPIVQKKDIPFEHSNNSALWADIVVRKGDTVRVFNVHMETTGMNRSLNHLSNLQANAGNLAKGVFEQYMINGVVRAGQSILLANEKQKSPYPIVLCGDLNDVPYSYTYNTLLGNLKDGFKEAGHGLASTYRGAKGVFRIDYIFHSDKFEGTDYYTIDQDYSDHKPVYNKLKIKS